MDKETGKIFTEMSVQNAEKGIFGVMELARFWFGGVREAGGVELPLSIMYLRNRHYGKGLSVEGVCRLVNFEIVRAGLKISTMKFVVEELDGKVFEVKWFPEGERKDLNDKEFEFLGLKMFGCEEGLLKMGQARLRRILAGLEHLEENTKQYLLYLENR